MWMDDKTNKKKLSPLKEACVSIAFKDSTKSRSCVGTASFKWMRETSPELELLAEFCLMDKVNFESRQEKSNLPLLVLSAN